MSYFSNTIYYYNYYSRDYYYYNFHIYNIPSLENDANYSFVPFSDVIFYIKPLCLLNIPLLFREFFGIPPSIYEYNIELGDSDFMKQKLFILHDIFGIKFVSSSSSSKSF